MEKLAIIPSFPWFQNLIKRLPVRLAPPQSKDWTVLIGRALFHWRSYQPIGEGSLMQIEILLVPPFECLP